MNIDTLQRVLDLIALHKFDQAARAARQVIISDPGNAKAHYYLAWAMRKWGKSAEALDPVQTAVKLQPDLAYAHDLYAMLLEDAGQSELAEEHHQQAIRLLPTEPDFYVSYAYGLPPTRSDEALQLLAQALQCDPRHVGAYQVRAELLRQTQDYAQAQRDILAALELDPNDWRSHVTLGDNYMDRQQASQAFHAYRNALRLKPYGDQRIDREIREKIVQAFQLKMPFLGWFWSWSWAGPGGCWRSFISMLIIFVPFFCMFIASDENHICATLYIYLICFAFILMNILGDYLLTRLILNGWIKI